MVTTGKYALVALSLCALSLAGCASVGPKSVARDRFDYTGALGDSWKQQTLLNMVKVRYLDTPVFLDVASVINQYSLETGVNVGGQVAAEEKSADTYLGMSGQGTFTDRPTITYTPLSGEKFARSLMRPLQPLAILSLIQAGYPIDRILMVSVHSVNGVRNRYGGFERAREADPEFYPLLERLRRIQDSGAVGLRFQKLDETEAVLLSFEGKVDPSVREDIVFVRETLGLDQSADEYRVVYGSQAKDGRELAILSRSIIEIIIDLASYIDVPAVHVEEKRVNATKPPETAGGISVPPLIGVHSSMEKPEDAYIVVPYRNHWFWIDDRDLKSKSVFSFLMLIFSLAETGGKEGAPIITIPAG